MDVTDPMTQRLQGNRSCRVRCGPGFEDTSVLPDGCKNASVGFWAFVGGQAPRGAGQVDKVLGGADPGMVGVYARFSEGGKLTVHPYQPIDLRAGCGLNR